MQLLVSLLLISLFLLPAGSFAEQSQMDGIAIAPVDNSYIMLQYGEVSSVERGYIFRIGPPNQSFKLAGIIPPEDEAAQLYLERLIKHTDSYPLYIYTIEDTNSRYAEPYSIIKTADSSQTMQEAMIREGMARFFPFGFSPDDRMIERLQSAEAEARTAQKGLWSDPSRIMNAHAIDETKQGKIVTVIGTIASATEKDNFTYINFGDNWKEDFTIMIPAEVWSQFSQDQKIKLTTPTLNVLVRGALSSYYGPMIKVKHPAQIEILP